VTAVCDVKGRSDRGDRVDRGLFRRPARQACQCQRRLTAAPWGQNLLRESRSDEAFQTRPETKFLASRSRPETGVGYQCLPQRRMRKCSPRNSFFCWRLSKAAATPMVVPAWSARRRTYRSHCRTPSKDSEGGAVEDCCRNLSATLVRHCSNTARQASLRFAFCRRRQAVIAWAFGISPAHRR
jgi:hypothetical protein